MFGSNIIHTLQLVLIFGNAVYAQSDSDSGYSYSPGDGHCDTSYNNKQFNYDEGETAFFIQHKEPLLHLLTTCSQSSSTDDNLLMAQVNYAHRTGGYVIIWDNDKRRDDNASITGDCCECTCADGPFDECDSYTNVFSCMDPNSGCLDPLATEYPNCTGYISLMENGLCDQDLNNPECGFDGGDCCECTCLDGPRFYFCGDDYSHPYSCLDPDSGCVNPRAAEFSNCTGDLAYAGDGSCDDFNNSPACGFDWGDCCFCSFVEEADISTLREIFYPSYTAEFDCLDSNASDELYGCMASPLLPLPCSGDSDDKLVVEGLADVNVLAETVYCTGGEFEVKWKGHIMVDESIVVPTGTVLNVTGMGPNATIYGGGVTRLFTVINSTLHVTNLRMTNGSSVFGGAIYSSGSTLTFNGTTFVDNVASASGGALLMSDGSNACFRETIFSTNKAPAGGAVHLSNGRALWEETTTFSANTADIFGGAVYVSEVSESSWVGVTTFSDNTVKYYYGGAVCVQHGGHASWVGETIFSGNIAGFDGGALASFYGSKASWTGVMTFSGNAARFHGGALYASSGSEVSWAGETTFSGNLAGDQGGAAYVQGVIRHSSTTKTTFRSNIAKREGGALYVRNYGVFLGADILFFNNTANAGGALFVTETTYVVLDGETNFTANTAFSDGGAVLIGYSPPNEFFFGFTVPDSNLVFNSSISFVNNSAGANGGGMAHLGTLPVLFSATSVTFYGNVANVAGGGVYLNNMAKGPTFNEITFDSNSAKMGGGMYATGSGTFSERGSSGQKVIYYPVTIIGCTFVNNVAEVSGGAVITASGRYKFLETSFVLNLASVGGALRLTGEAFLDACSFVENISDPDEGPAVSTLGIISNFSAGYFKDNKYVCGIHTFLSFTESQKGELFGKVCYGCQDTQCKDCDFEEPNLVPQCISLSEAGIEHANSIGGLSTLEDLLVFKGYWRATNTSTDVKKCYNANACPGGLTTGNCNPGYRGPYCAVCRQDYVASLGFTCNKCSDSTKGIAMAFVFTAISVAVLAAAMWYLMSSEIREEERGVMGQVIRRLLVQSGKIIIVAWQILTQFASVANVTFPNVYQDFLDGVNVLNFDLSWVASPGCFMSYDFYNRLLLTTIGPVGTISLLGVTYAIAERRNRASEIALRTVRQKHASVALLVVFLLYSNVSSVVFQTFSCDPLDDGNSYLRADYSIECYNKEHRAYQIYAAIMIFVYPVGIPALFAGLLFRNKQVLQDNTRSKDDLMTKSTMNLWEPYKPSRFYYEVIECFRRILLTGVVVFIYPGSAAQIAVTYMMAAVFAMMAEILSPYKSKWDAWVSRAGHALVMTSMFLALLLKIDISDEESSSEQIFEFVLVAAHACVVVTVVVEALVMACALKVTCRRRDPTNRKVRPRTIDASLVDASRPNDALNGEGGVEHKAELEGENN